MRPAVLRRITLIAIGLACLALSASNAPLHADAKGTFLAREKMYLSFEIVLTGEKKFGAGADEFHDGAHVHHRTVKGMVPLEMAVPGSYPLSSMPMETMEMIEEGRFVGWMASPPEDPDTEAMLASGKLDLSRSHLFLPVEF